jgi:flagellar motor switch protein FliG
MKASDLEKIVEEAQQMNGISDKDKKEILKNLEADLNESSSSNSAEN